MKRKLFQSPIDQETVRKLWNDRGFSCHLYVDEPGQEWNDFVHSTNELVTIIHGRLLLTVGKEELTLNIGDELFIPARARHSVKNIFDRETQWLFGYD